ncbi:MAG TPA: hypothetical protein PLW65_07120 [Pseudomonadota bacterium]|nr:hypothetical protein [Pseudomonadota bacterium]
MAEKQLSLFQSLGMLVAGILIIVLDGGEMKWRVGGRNGAPAVYFAYLFVAGGLIWSIFAIKGYLQAKKEGQ